MRISESSIGEARRIIALKPQIAIADVHRFIKAHENAVVF
jgi:hypothetical protein